MTRPPSAVDIAVVAATLMPSVQAELLYRGLPAEDQMERALELAVRLIGAAEDLMAAAAARP